VPQVVAPEDAWAARQPQPPLQPHGRVQGDDA
jgi:hypothetical protein